jgi:hypothetical protein
VKRSLLKGQGGKKKRGRSKKKWLETVTAGGRMLGVTDWRRASQKRCQLEKHD